MIIESFSFYEYKCVSYMVEAEILVKDPTTRAWVPHILYRERHTTNHYAREKQEFIKLFTLTTKP